MLASRLVRGLERYLYSFFFKRVAESLGRSLIVIPTLTGQWVVNRMGQLFGGGEIKFS